MHAYIICKYNASYIFSSVIHNYAEDFRQRKINAITYANVNYARYESMHMFIRL